MIGLDSVSAVSVQEKKQTFEIQEMTPSRRAYEPLWVKPGQWFTNQVQSKSRFAKKIQENHTNSP